jgi:hypothetical protein
MDYRKYLEQHHSQPTHTSIESVFFRPSSEGLLESLGDTFRNMRHGKTEKIPANSDMKQVLSRTYLNYSWLSNRRFVEGTVSVKGGNYLQGNWEAQARKLLQASRAAAHQDEQLVIKLTHQIDTVSQFFASGKWKDAKACRAFLDKLIFNDDLNDPKWTQPTEAYQAPETAKLPALDKDGVQATAKLMLELYEGNRLATPFGKKWYDRLAPMGGDKMYTSDNPFEDEIDKHWSSDPELADKLKYLVNEVSECAYGAEHSYYHASESYQHYYVYITNYIEAMAKWIDASVK